MWWKNLSIRWKIIIGFSLADILMIFMGCMALTEIHRQTGVQRNIYAKCTVVMEQMGLYTRNFEKARRNAVDFASAMDAGKMQDLMSSFREGNKTLDSLDKAYLENNPEDSDDYNDLRKTRADWQAAVEKEFSTLSSASVDARIAFRQAEVSPRARAVDDKIAKVMSSNSEKGKNFVDAAAKSASRGMMINVFLVILNLVLCMIIGSLIVRSIMKPLQVIKKVLEVVAQQNLSSRANLTIKDEFGAIAADLDHTLDILGSLIHNLRDNSVALKGSSDTLASVGNELAASADQTSAHTQSTSAAVEELSSSMQTVSAASEQMSSNLNTIASAVEEMSISVDGVAKNTEVSRAAVDDATQRARSTGDEIGKLEQAAQAIGGMVQLIEGIAEQTKLLALNATIEAARAGEAGKGFAVVASEVKSLAQNTAKATNEIRTTVGTMQQVTSKAVSDVRDIQGVLEKTLEVVAGNASAIQQQASTTREISSNLGQASAGLQEVNQNVASAADVSKTIAADMGQVRGNNQKVMEEIRRMKEDTTTLANMAKQLDTTVEAFKL